MSRAMPSRQSENVPCSARVRRCSLWPSMVRIPANVTLPASSRAGFIAISYSSPPRRNAEQTPP